MSIFLIVIHLYGIKKNAINNAIDFKINLRIKMLTFMFNNVHWMGLCSTFLPLNYSFFKRWKDPSLGKLIIFQRGQITRGTRRNQLLEPSPPIACGVHNVYIIVSYHNIKHMTYPIQN
jgi:hypothetical protein